MNKRLKSIHTFSVYVEVVTMLEIDINVQVLTQNLKIKRDLPVS